MYDCQQRLFHPRVLGASRHSGIKLQSNHTQIMSLSVINSFSGCSHRPIPRSCCWPPTQRLLLDATSRLCHNSSRRLSQNDHISYFLQPPSNHILQYLALYITITDGVPIPRAYCSPLLFFKSFVIREVTSI